MAQDDILHEQVINMSNESGLGGEGLSLHVKFIDNGDKIEYNKDGEVENNGIFMNQEISLQSYCNSASIKLFGNPLTPDMLREMANQLEKAEIAAAYKKIAIENKSKVKPKTKKVKVK